MGYAGGTKEDPTYQALGDHTEVIQVDYNPDKTSYEQLLKVFWSNHDPTSQAWKRQYWNAIFVQNETQADQAETSLDAIKDELSGTVQTKILPIRSFTRAEQYHQKYYLQQRPTLVQKLQQPFSDLKSFLDSTVAARANAFIAREISEDTLRELLDDATYSTLHPNAWSVRKPSFVAPKSRSFCIEDAQRWG